MAAQMQASRSARGEFISRSEMTTFVPAQRNRFWGTKLFHFGMCPERDLLENKSREESAGQNSHVFGIRARDLSQALGYLISAIGENAHRGPTD